MASVHRFDWAVLGTVALMSQLGTPCGVLAVVQCARTFWSQTNIGPAIVLTSHEMSYSRGDNGGPGKEIIAQDASCHH